MFIFAQQSAKQHLSRYLNWTLVRTETLSAAQGNNVAVLEHTDIDGTLQETSMKVQNTCQFSLDKMPTIGHNGDLDPSTKPIDWQPSGLDSPSKDTLGCAKLDK